MKCIVSLLGRVPYRLNFCLGVFLVLMMNLSAPAQSCQDIQRTLDRLVSQRAAFNNQLHAPGTLPADRVRLQQELHQLPQQISTSQVALRSCQRTVASASTKPLAVPDCSSIQQTLNGLEAYRIEISKELQQPGITPADRSRLQEQLRLVGEQISATQLSLNECQQAGSPGAGGTPPPGGTASERILQIVYKNPAFDETKYKFDWGKELATGSSDPTNSDTFPQNIGREWVQVLDPGDDYDRTVVGATGWAINPRPNTVDFPFDHPFQPDWETSLALDRPQATPGAFLFLLSNGDKGTLDHTDQLDDESRAAARGLPTLFGLLGVEMDANLIPTQFKQNITEGNRLAIFGRWIIDAGHNNYRAEIHQPLMMAVAAPMGDNGTRVLFTSRPFLVGHTYTVDTNQIYNDNAADDGTFYPHLIHELAKVVGLACPIPNVPCSTLVESHVKIKSHPFEGVQLLHFLVRPPSVPAQLAVLHRTLVVSFHFTVRAGCAVQVISSAPDTIDVLVAMNSVGYHPPPLPARTTHNYSRDELTALDNGVGSQILDIQAGSDALATLTGTPVKGIVVNEILSHGMQGDIYSSISDSVDILSRANAVENAAASNIPANAGITLNDSDNQPYPVTGWIEAKWADVTSASPPQPAHPVHAVEPIHQ